MQGVGGRTRKRILTLVALANLAVEVVEVLAVFARVFDEVLSTPHCRQMHPPSTQTSIFTLRSPSPLLSVLPPLTSQHSAALTYFMACVAFLARWRYSQ